ncbi:MAG: MarC family protein [Bdellovibrionota bacterium]
MKEFITYFLYAFTSLFTIVNPLGAMPFYMGMVDDVNKQLARDIALRAALAAFTAMMFFALTGKFLFSFFNVSVDGLRVVGGVLFFITGFDMLQGKDSRTKSVTASEKFSLQDIRTKAITPLAIPLICGPGTITVLTVMIQEADEIWQKSSLIFSAFLVSVATFFVLVSSKKITSIIGESGQKVFYRLMGLILMMNAVEFFFNGIRPYVRSLLQQ